MLGETSPRPPLISRRAFLRSAALASGGLALYAGTHARHELEVVRRTIRIHELPDGFRGFRMVQISDIHLVEWTEPWFLQHAVDTINNLGPDLVVLTGDFISRGPGSADVAFRAMPVCADVLSGLHCPRRYAVLGNHDATVDGDMVIRELKSRRIPTLINSFVAIESGNDHIWLSGVDDPGVNTPDLTAAVPPTPSSPVILLAHEPDYADVVRRHPRAHSIDLMLSGHTHGGQVRLPVFGPLVLPPMGRRYVAGEYQLGNIQLHVNRGLGTVGMPFRLNCPPEITELTLQRA